MGTQMASKYGNNAANRELRLKYQALCAYQLRFPALREPALAGVSGRVAAPLLKERESFLTMKSKEGLSRLTLMGWAGYSLKFIQYFNLYDGEKRIVSLDDVVEAARPWSSPIPDHYHSRKRHDCPSSRIKFIESPQA